MLPSRAAECGLFAAHRCLDGDLVKAGPVDVAAEMARSPRAAGDVMPGLLTIVSDHADRSGYRSR